MTIKVTYNVTDVYMSQSVSPVYINVSYSDGGSSGGGVWGTITGTLSNQIDLQTALDLKLDESTIDGGTEGQILSKASGTDFDFTWINNYAKYLATNVRNQTGSTIAAFQVVYISGATGNKPLISLADADTEATSSKTYGVTATSIANNGTGDVVTAGELTGINTSAFNEGDLLWLSTTAGGVVTSPPAEPAHAVFIGYVVRSHPTLGTIDVSIQNGYELNELHGVQITTPTDNQGLFYNATSTLWENKSITTALGFTPVPISRTITINGVTFDLSADRSFSVGTITGSGTANELAYFTASTTLASLSVSTYPSLTEISYVKGVTSALQTQLNAKQGTLTLTTTGTSGAATLIGNTLNIPQYSGGGGGISGSGASGQVTYWTGASAVSGSNNLFWDAVTSRLGIGTNAPAVNLDIISTANAYLRVQRGNNGSNDAAFITQPQGTLSASNVSWNYGLQLGSNNFRFWYFNGTATTSALNITNTGNVHIGSGTDATVRLQVAGDTLLRGSGATNATTALTVQNSSSTNLFSVRNDGNVGIGVTPSDWGSAVKGFQLGNLNGLSMFSYNGGAEIGQNVYYTTIYKYATSAPASIYVQNNGRHYWRTASSGTANANLTFTNAMTLDEFGKLGIMNTPTAYIDITASTTTNASLRIRSGTAPTSPNDGDIWFDGTDIKMRIGGVTKTFTLI